jgi:hypothetical protein
MHDEHCGKVLVAGRHRANNFDRPMSFSPNRLLFVFAALLPVVGHAGPVGDLRVRTTAGWAENLSRSVIPTDQKASALYEVTAATGWSRQLSGSVQATAGLEAAALVVDRHSLNNRGTFGPRVSARHKFGLGPLAPVLEAEIGVTQRFARAPGDRGTTTEGGLTLAKRLNPAWRVSATTDWSDHAARSPAFDVHHRRLHGAVTWDITDRWQAAAGGGRLDGVFAANASWPVWGAALGGALGPVVQEYYNSIPWRITNLYGPGWVTYPVSGHADFWWLELAPALGPRSTLALRYERADAVNRVGIKYRQERWTLGLLLRL